MSAEPNDPIFEEINNDPSSPTKVQRALSLRQGSKMATRLFLERVEELQMKGLDCDPIQILMEIASGKVLMHNGTVEMMKPFPDPAVRGKAAAELCSYIFPKRKAMELSSDPENPVQFMVIPDQDPLPGAQGVVTIDGNSCQSPSMSRQLAEVITDDEDDD